MVTRQLVIHVVATAREDAAGARHVAHDDDKRIRDMASRGKRGDHALLVTRRDGRGEQRSHHAHHRDRDAVRRAAVARRREDAGGGRLLRQRAGQEGGECSHEGRRFRQPTRPNQEFVARG